MDDATNEMCQNDCEWPMRGKVTADVNSVQPNSVNKIHDQTEHRIYRNREFPVMESDAYTFGMYLHHFSGYPKHTHLRQIRQTLFLATAMFK